MTNISELTNDCLKQISSLTSHKDVVELLATIKQLITASESDDVWEKFLPSNCDDIVSQSSSSIPPDQLASKKKLFLYLSRCPILLDKSTMSFALNETSGKVCYTLGSRALSITSDGYKEDWSFESVPGSRFPECTVLKNVYRLIKIQGNIPTTLLSRDTTYGAYFVFKIIRTGFGLVPVKVSVSVIQENGLPINDHVVETKIVYLEASRSHQWTLESPPGGFPVVRGDGWMEIEMGRFRVGVNGERVKLEMSLKEMETSNWNKELVVDGIEIRPLS